MAGHSGIIIESGNTIRFDVALRGMPVAKGRPRSTSKGRVYTPMKTRNYERDLAAVASMKMGKAPLMEGQIAINVRVYVTPPKCWSRKRKEEALAGYRRPVTRPDVDNYLKIVMDALESVVYERDSQVVTAEVSKWYAAAPQMSVLLYKVLDR